MRRSLETPFGTSLVVSKDLVVCGWGLPESLLNGDMCSGLAGESKQGGPCCLSLGVTMRWSPCSLIGAAQAWSRSSSGGIKEGLWRPGASWLIFFFIPWSLDFSGGFCFKRSANKSFPCYMGVSPLGWVEAWGFALLCSYDFVSWVWMGCKVSRAAYMSLSHCSRCTRRNSHPEQKCICCLWAYLQYICGS